MPNLNLVKNMGLRFQNRKRKPTFIEAAISIDKWEGEFACLSLDDELEQKFSERFNPDGKTHTWVFNDNSHSCSLPKEDERNTDEFTAKEYRVIALLFAHEMQQTGDL